jgi:alcohol dehydrogenase (cytochrome c)
VILVDTEIGGRKVKAAIHSGKHGYMVAVDPTNGQFLCAKPFVPRITWTTGLDAKGRPSVGLVPGKEQTPVCPGAIAGAKGWQHAAYSPQLDYVFIPAGDACDEILSVPMEKQPNEGDMIIGGEWKKQDSKQGLLQALDAKTGEIRWSVKSRFANRTSACLQASVADHPRPRRRKGL